MKRLILIAAMLTSPAFAQDATPPVAPVEPAKPATPAIPQNPTIWNLEGLDAADLGLINQCIVELPKRVADPFIVKINSKLKPVR